VEGVSFREGGADFVGGVGAPGCPAVRSQPVEFLASVDEDLRYAYDYYDSWRSDGQIWFRARFRETVSWIEWNPEMFPKKHRFFRRAVIHNSYFGIFFVIEAEVTTVVAVRDMRDDPEAIRRILIERQKG
jgi:hypothetical protein